MGGRYVPCVDTVVVDRHSVTRHHMRIPWISSKRREGEEDGLNREDVQVMGGFPDERASGRDVEDNTLRVIVRQMSLSVVERPVHPARVHYPTEETVVNEKTETDARGVASTFTREKLRI